MRLPKPIAQAAEIALNQLLDRDPVTAERLTPYLGKRLDIFVEGAALNASVRIGDRAIALIDPEDALADVTVSGSAPDFLKVLREGSAGSGALQIDGDIELGTALLGVARELDLDWEGWLASIVGGSGAHWLRKSVDQVWQEAAQTRTDLQRTLSDFLQYESRLVADRGAADEFASAVDRLREDTDRLAARIERLTNELADRQKGKTP